MSSSYQPSCPSCNTTLVDHPEVHNEISNPHPLCYQCTHCHQNFPSHPHTSLLGYEGVPLSSLSIPACFSCKFPITSDEIVQTSDKTYHASCFKCIKCLNPIEGSLFAKTNNGIYCISCYNLRREAKKKCISFTLNQTQALELSLKTNRSPILTTSDDFKLMAGFNTLEPESIEGNSKRMDGLSNPLNIHTGSKGDSEGTPSLISSSLEENNNLFCQSSCKESNHLQTIIQNLNSDMKLLQDRLTESEVENLSFKIANQQNKDKVTSVQMELNQEIQRRKEAEKSLIQLENQQKSQSKTISDLETSINELIAKQHLLKKEVNLLQERKDLLEEVISVKQEIKIFTKGTENSRHSLDVNQSPMYPISPALTRCYNSSEILSHNDPKSNRRKGSLPALDELGTLASTDITLQRRFRLNQAKRLPSSILESVIKPKTNLSRRSLDILPLDERHFLYKFDKRGSVDQLSSGFNSPGLEDDYSAPSSQSDTFSLPNTPTILPDKSSIDKEFKNSESKKFKWKNAFKMVPKPNQYINDTNLLKALMLSPKSIKPSLTIDQGLSEPILFTSPELPCFPSEAEMKYQPTSLTLDPELTTYRYHKFMNHTYIRPVKCDSCKEKMWGRQAKTLRCSDCNFNCHLKCSELNSVPCPGIRKPTRRSSQPISVDHGLSNNYPNDSLVVIAENTIITPQLPFGRELKTQLESEGEGIEVPGIVQRCVDIVDSKGLKIEGIYRVSGPHSTIKSIRQQLNTTTQLSLDEIQSSPDFNDVTAVTSVLKQYFRELPTPLFTYNYYDDWIQITQLTADSDRITGYSNIIKELPKVYKDTLVFFMDHLNRVYQNNTVNLMTSKNIGVVFGPTLLRCRDTHQDLDETILKNTTIELLIQDWDKIQLRLQD